MLNILNNKKSHKNKLFIFLEKGETKLEIKRARRFAALKIS